MWFDESKKWLKHRWDSTVGDSHSNEEQATQKELTQLLSLFSKANNEDELVVYTDPLVTKEQKKRDKYISLLLEEYVSFYKSKTFHSKICRYIILIPCVLIIIAFSILSLVLSTRILNVGGNLNIQDVVAFITACISFISLIIGLLTIITKYFFPENDEQYVTTIVESIQRNDLENKKEYKADGKTTLSDIATAISDTRNTFRFCQGTRTR